MKRLRCLRCQTFFTAPDARREKYCSPACRIAATICPTEMTGNGIDRGDWWRG